MAKDLSVSIVRGDDGSVDQDATLEAFSTALGAFVQDEETQDEVIADAVRSQFDRYQGQAQTMPALISGTLSILNTQPQNHKLMSERVANYVRKNSGDRESGALFVIGKGKAGGCKRWSDQKEAVKPAPASAKK